VKANVLCFDKRGTNPSSWATEVWYYDYHANIHHTLKKRPLGFEDLAEEIIENLEAGLNSFRAGLAGVNSKV